MKNIGYDSYTSWFVTFSCTIISCLSATPYRLAGLIYVLIIENYDTNRETASIPILLFLLIRCLAGPLLSVLVKKIGLELVTVIGCVLTAVGFGTCFFAHNVVGVILLLGIVYGVGLACSTTFTPNIVKKHFKKNFNSANGISAAGPCLGAFVIPPTATFLIDLYGVSGAFLIWSGIMLNAFPLGIYVYRAGIVQDNLIKHRMHEDKTLRNEEKEINETEEQTNIDTHLNVKTVSENVQYSLNTEYTNKEGQIVPSVSLGLVPQNHEQLEKNSDKFNTKLGFATRSGLCPELHPLKKEENQNFPNKSNAKVSEKTENISSPALEKKSKEIRKKNVYGFKVFTDISFLLLALIFSITAYVSSTFWTTAIDYARDKGISRNLEIYFLMVQPIVDLIGRACFGWITDRGYLTLPNFAMICYGQMAVAMVFITWTNRFWVMLAGCCCYALASGAMLSAQSGIIFECIEEHHHTMAISARLCVFGALVFTSSPLIGYFRENLGSYDGLYCLFIVLCILSVSLIPLAFKFSKHARTTKTNAS